MTSRPIKNLTREANGSAGRRLLVVQKINDLIHHLNQNILTTANIVGSYVISFNGRSGDVTLADSDIPLTNGHVLVGNAGNFAADKAMSGDATIANTGALTLATVNASPGTYGAASSVPVITVNAKGLDTTVTTTPVSAVGGQDANPITLPQGRLYLQSNFAVQTIDQVGVSTIYYGLGLVPVWNGSKWVYLTCDNQISMGLDAVTPHVASGKLYDVFGISNGGSLALCISSPWSYAATITTTIASPAVVSWAGHGLLEGAPVVFSTTGALPTGITAGTTYYVGRSPGANSFNIATSVANAAAGTFVNTSGSQSGTHTATNSTLSPDLSEQSSALQLLNGIWVNRNSLTHAWGGASGTTDYGPIAANRATWLGTFLATANGQTTMQLTPAAAAGGNNTILGLYNAYNRVRVTGMSRDSTSSWSYSTATWRAANNSVSNRVTWVDGGGQTPIEAHGQTMMGPASGGAGFSGVLLDSTNGNPHINAQFNFVTSGAFSSDVADGWAPPIPGVHYAQLAEASSGTTTFFGSSTSPTRQSTAVSVSILM